MIKKLITSAMVMFTVAVFAQEPQESQNSGRYVTNKFFDNWFISIGGGGQVYYGEHDTEASFGDRIAPVLDISLGKWVTPEFGIRAQYAGLSAKGVTSSTSARFIDGVYEGSLYEESFNMLSLHGDLMWNISNTIGGYRPDRTIEFIPFAGLGFAQSSKEDVNPKYREVAMTAGLLNKVRLSDAVNLNLELRAMMVNDRFDGYEVGQGIEELVSASIGFTYNFPQRGFQEYEKPVAPNYAPYTSKIDELEQKLADSDAKADKLASDLAAEKNRKPEVVKSVEYMASPLAIFFPIGQARLTDKDLINIANFAEAVKKSGKTYKILGSADSATGSEKRNMQLSQQRANAVYDALVNKFGVDPDQLEVIAKGEENEPFDKPVLNRVVVLE
jgi:outer membrane protein OmpA-like peptidoglycan-associated protein